MSLITDANHVFFCLPVLGLLTGFITMVLCNFMMNVSTVFSNVLVRVHSSHETTELRY